MLIAFGVAAKVIVVIEDQNRFVWPVLLAIKHRCRQAAQPRAHHDQVVVFVDWFGDSRLITALPAPLVSNGIRAGMTPSQAGQCRWVGSSVMSVKQRRDTAHTGTGQCDGAAVDEVSAREFRHVTAFPISSDSSCHERHEEWLSILALGAMAHRGTSGQIRCNKKGGLRPL